MEKDSLENIEELLKDSDSAIVATKKGVAVCGYGLDILFLVNGILEAFKQNGESSVVFDYIELWLTNNKEKNN